MLLICSETKKVEVSIHQEILNVSYSWMSTPSLYASEIFYGTNIETLLEGTLSVNGPLEIH